ncbi:MAG: peptide deformylase [Synergistaceae bacterium]|jgi:peptide deformylase|nr:peptide deformylase [Synergistaceae bacterium]
MAVLDVLIYPNSALRVEASEIIDWDGGLKKLITDMWETMYTSKGVGLAAPQVGVSKRLIVIEYEGERHVVINPRIIEEEGFERADEGCLSFPGIYESVERPAKIHVIYRDETGSQRDEVIDGFLARVFAHEIDHLSGRLFIDRLSPLKKSFIRQKMERQANGRS